MSSSSRLGLHTPLSRAARLATAKRRIEYAKQSERFRTQKDIEKDSWPWQIQYLGYTGLALSVPGGVLTAIIEQPKFRTLLEGDDFGNGGFGIGKRLVSWWRGYYTADDKGVVQGFHNEDWSVVSYRRRRREKEGGRPVSVKVNSDIGKVSVLEFGEGEVVGKEDVLKASGFGNGGTIAKVELVDDSTEAGVSGIVGEEEGDDDGEGGDKKVPDLIKLTSRTSTWHVVGEEGAKEVKKQIGNERKVVKEARADKTRRIKEEIRITEEKLNDPYNTEDIDELTEKIKIKKSELGWGFW